MIKKKTLFKTQGFPCFLNYGKQLFTKQPNILYYI